VLFPKWQLPKSVISEDLCLLPVLAVALGSALQRLRRPNLGEVATWEAALGKMPLGKNMIPLNAERPIKLRKRKMTVRL